MKQAARRVAFAVSLGLLVALAGATLTAELARVPSGTWTAGPPLATPRSGAAAVLLADGRVLVTGGRTDAGPLGTVELFDGTRFTAAAPMGSPRERHTATRLADGRVLVAGGLDDAGIAVSDAEIFDPATGDWSSAGPLVQPRAGHSAVLMKDGRVLLAGGEVLGLAIASVEVFDPATRTFSPAGELGVARADLAAALLGDGRVVLAGGRGKDGVSRTLETFDPATGAVAVSGALFTPRAGASATTLLDGTVLLAGGSDGDQETATAEVVDGSLGDTLLVTQVKPMLAARQGHAAFLLPASHTVLVVGGTASGLPVDTAELFVPWLSEFRPTGAPTTLLRGPAGAALKQDGLLLLAGASDADGSTQLYGFATLRTDANDYPPGTPVIVSGDGWQPGEVVTIVIHELAHFHGDITYTAIADDEGRIANSQFAPDVEDLGLRFYATAYGGGSGSTAQTTFAE